MIGAAMRYIEDLPPIYLANGVLDVIVVDPEQRRVLRIDADGRTNTDPPSTLAYAAAIG